MPNVTVMILPDGPDAGVQIAQAAPPRFAMQNILTFIGLGLSLMALYAAYQTKQAGPPRRLAHGATDSPDPGHSPAQLAAELSPTGLSPTAFSLTESRPTVLSPASVDECVVDITAVTRDEDLPPARGGVAS